MPHRRTLLAAALLASAAVRPAAAAPTRVSVWRDPHCGCCAGWVRDAGAWAARRRALQKRVL